MKRTFGFLFFSRLPHAAIFISALSAFGCGSAPTPPPNTGGTQTTTQASSGGTQGGTNAGGTAQGGESASANPFEIKRKLREERVAVVEDGPLDASMPKLPKAPKELPAAPKSCDAYVKRKAEKAPVCADSAAALSALDAAMSEGDAAKRDAKLAGLEACAGMPVGLARELRVELAPTECADGMAEGILNSPPTNMRKPAYYALLGHAVAARLARAAQNGPKMSAPYSRDRVKEFVNGPMAAWMKEQAQVIEELSKIGAALPFYARGVAGVEAGTAEMRMVETVRNAPLPKEIADDEELRNAYYGQLDQVLDPRKDRGRDAALVGLGNLAILGVLKSERVDRARALLSKLYGGRRIDALDPVLLPPLSAAAPASLEERLAMKLPTFAAGFLLDPKAATRAGTLRALLEKGIAPQLRVALNDPNLEPQIRALYARAHVELGRLYFRASDFDQAIGLLSAGFPENKRPEDMTLLLATAIALGDGPEDAGEMMRRAPLSSIGFGQVGALDAVAKGSGPYAGTAAFNAAIVLQIAAPQGAKAAYWKDVAARFQNAASVLPEGAAKNLALDRAKAAKSVADAIKE